MSFWVNLFDQLNWNRDIIIYDHRGTGLSYPQPGCEELRAIHYKNLSRSVSEEEYYREIYAQINSCHQELDLEVNLSNFSTLHNTQDLRDLIDSLQYPLVNLFGVSYGTRVALELMRRSSKNLRSVILDSPFPPSINDSIEWPSILDNTIKIIFKYCENKSDCNKKYPNLKKP